MLNRTSMRHILYYILVFSLLSCKSNLYKIYERGINNKDEYVLVNKMEVEKYISSEKQIFYINSDIDFHYFKVYNTSFPTKFVLKFKVKKDDIIVDKINVEKRIKVVFEENDNLRIINR